MIDIPIGKAIAAVENATANCIDCDCLDDDGSCMVPAELACTEEGREDRKNVIFKLVDYKEGTRMKKSGTV